MTTEDAEIEAMRIILGLVQNLDAGAQDRVVRWISDRFPVAPEPVVGVPEHQNGVATTTPNAETLPETARARTSAEYVARLDPESATERLLCLLAWTEISGADDAAIRDLDDLNSEVGGSTFSSAGSMAQSAIKNGYAHRPRPGHLALTDAGRRVVGSLSARSQSGSTGS